MGATLPFQAVDLEHVAQTQLYADFSCLCLPCCWPCKLCQSAFVPLSQHPCASRTCPHHTSSLRLSNDLASRSKDQTYSSLLIKYFQLRLMTLSNHIFNEDYVLYLWSLSLSRQEYSLWAWTISHSSSTAQLINDYYKRWIMINWMDMINHFNCCKICTCSS